MGEIGPVRKRREFIPMPADVPIAEPSPAPAPEPAEPKRELEPV